MEAITVAARVEALPQVNAFVGATLAACACSDRTRRQIELAVEEIFVNIACYAYDGTDGTAEVGVACGGDPPALTVRLSDSGRPFDPLRQPPADTTAPAQTRAVGGLGILLARRLMDSVAYVRQDGCNVLTMTKALTAPAGDGSKERGNRG